jgi:hypothetical protein
MRRDDLIRGLENVRATLVAAKVYRIFQTMSRLDRTTKDGPLPHAFYQEVITGFSEFNVRAQAFMDAEKTILKDYSLMELLDSKTWLGEKMQAKDESPISYRIRVALDTIPIIGGLLKRESEKREIILETSQNNKKHRLQTKRLTFIIRERETPSLELASEI